MVGPEFKHLPQLVIDWGRKIRNHFVPITSTDPSFLNICTMSCTSLRFSGDWMDEINFTTVTFGLISVIFTMAAGGNKGMAKECKGAAKDGVAVKPESVRCFMIQAPVMPCVVKRDTKRAWNTPKVQRLTQLLSFYQSVWIARWLCESWVKWQLGLMMVGGFKSSKRNPIERLLFMGSHKSLWNPFFPTIGTSSHHFIGSNVFKNPVCCRISAINLPLKKNRGSPHSITEDLIAVAALWQIRCTTKLKALGWERQGQTLRCVFFFCNICDTM